MLGVGRWGRGRLGARSRARDRVRSGFRGRSTLPGGLIKLSNNLTELHKTALRNYPSRLRDETNTQPFSNETIQNYQPKPKKADEHVLPYETKLNRMKPHLNPVQL